MARPKALDEDQLAKAVASLDSWSVATGRLHKEFQFADFVEAFAFMTAAALWAERKNHHPEWFNVYKTVRVDLMTHDAGGITELDIEFASEMDRLASRGLNAPAAASSSRP